MQPASTPRAPPGLLARAARRPGTRRPPPRPPAGAAFAIAGVRASDTIAHCLNYALYAGGIADHMALEATGATVVPVGVGQSRRLVEELIAALGITAIFGT